MCGNDIIPAVAGVPTLQRRNSIEPPELALLGSWSFCRITSLCGISESIAVDMAGTVSAPPS